MSLDMTALSGSKPALWQIQWALLIPHAEELVSLSLDNAFELDNSEDRGSGLSGESAMLEFRALEQLEVVGTVVEAWEFLCHSVLPRNVSFCRLDLTCSRNSEIFRPHIEGIANRLGVWLRFSIVCYRRF